MTKKQATHIVEELIKMYPDAKCSLDFQNEFELLVAVILSAQCTDERVNKTTPTIFKVCHTPEEFANIDIKKLEELLHPCGFYHNKAKNIKAMANILVEKYHGKVPHTMEELQSLPGVGRKTANVVMLEAFHNPQGIAVDTHCKRIANRIGFSKKAEPEKIEQDLLQLIPKKYYQEVNHIFIWHGRNTCTARNPKCEECKLNKECKYYQEQA